MFTATPTAAPRCPLWERFSGEGEQSLQIGTFFSVSSQTSFFLLSVVLGAALGVVYDCFRVFRILFPPAAKAAAVAVQDVLFWLIYGFGIFLYSAAVCGGSLRFFMFIGSLLGFALYILTLGDLITGILRQLATAVYRILRKVYSVSLEPIVKFLRKNCQKLRHVFVGSYENAENVGQSEKNS